MRLVPLMFAASMAALDASAYVELSSVSQISVGVAHACAVTTSGALYCWGANDAGQLGVPGGGYQSVAALVPGMASGVASVSAGRFHTCVVTTSGGAKCWGANNTGQLGDGSTTDSSSPVDVAGLTSGVVALAAGDDQTSSRTGHTCAVTTAGGVKCWGANSAGELGDGTNTQSPTPVDVAGLSGVSAIAVADLHTCAIATGGAMFCWGANESGQLGDGTTTNRSTPVPVSSLPAGVVAISVGRGAAPGGGTPPGVILNTGGDSCAVTSAGTAKCWGANASGQVGDGTKTPRSTPFDVAGLSSGTLSISVGTSSDCHFGIGTNVLMSHACAIVSGGGVKCWGGNNHGELGFDVTQLCGTYQLTASDVPNLGPGQTMVGAGSAYTCAVGPDSKVRCWGWRTAGRLGDGSITGETSTPQVVLRTDSGLVPQTITFGAAPSIPVGGSGTLTATGGGSGNPVVMTSVTPSICTISGNTVTGVANGLCTIAANQAGSADFDPAPEATITFRIGDPVAQTITFGPAPTILVGGTGKVSATASSGLQVQFTSHSPSICSVSGDVVTGIAAGSCTIAANQGGDVLYSPAPETTQNVTITASASSVADVYVTMTARSSSALTGRDVVFDFTAGNNGPATASLTVTDALPGGVEFIWASPGCALASGTVTCSFSSVTPNATRQGTVVLRPSSAGTMSNTIAVSSTMGDPDYTNNSSTVAVSVSASPAATPVARYRLYNPISLEHLYTTDQNEYNVLGSQGVWQQEGTVGKVLDNPGSFNGVTAVPYYRLYNNFTLWHHWTTDPNEYYTLLTYPGWGGEGVDGYLLPTSATGTTQLYRLVYPNGTGLHHWTIDANEYNTLIGTYGWVGEGGSGFVIFP